jgi:hypothetical protein
MFLQVNLAISRNVPFLFYIAVRDLIRQMRLKVMQFDEIFILTALM